MTTSLKSSPAALKLTAYHTGRKLKPNLPPPKGTPTRKWSWQLGVALVVLFVVWVLSAADIALEKSIFPYALAVGLVTWSHGLMAGFMFAAIATLVALASGAFPTHPTSAGHEAIEGLITYAQLSVVCLTVYFVRWRQKKADH
jgi:hypothetical protein